MSVRILTGGAALAALIPVMANPAPEIRTDASIDMDGPQEPGKIWWVATDATAVLAWCAAWPDGADAWHCGSNYELDWRTRTGRFWPRTHRRRQQWLERIAAPASTWLHDAHPDTGSHDNVVRVHLDTGWTLTGKGGWSFDIPGQWCVQMAWTPT